LAQNDGSPVIRSVTAGGGQRRCAPTWAVRNGSNGSSSSAVSASDDHSHRLTNARASRARRCAQAVTANTSDAVSSGSQANRWV
jgi:hypothetical protein